MSLGGSKNDTLTSLRKMKFSVMSVTSRKRLQPECLPPAEGSAWQHSLRVYLQVTYWKTLLHTDINATEWGWQLKNDHLEPVMNEQVGGFNFLLILISSDLRRLFKIKKEMPKNVLTVILT